jgi:uncharacterized RDD family membrane protein YckC
MFSIGKKPAEHYASFSQRMWAATVDSVLFLILVLPFFEMALAAVYPVPQNPHAPGFEQLAAQGDNIHILGALMKNFYESGLFARWLVDTILQTLLLAAITGYFWKRWGATPGKMLFRMKVLDANTEQPISNEQILLRLVGYVISSAPIFLGFVWISFTKRHQGWHDMLAGTVVIRVPKSNS